MTRGRSGTGMTGL